MITKDTLKRLGTDFQTRLLSQPETGMGYQIIDNETNDKKKIKLVLNAEFTLDFENIFDPIDFIGQYQWDKLRQLFFQFPTYQPIIIDFEKFATEELRSDTLQTEARVETNFLYITNITPTTYPPFTYLSRRGDEFYRLSAHRNDKRVNKDGSLARGTFGTTSNDLKVVPSGAAAVGRYALPSRVPSTYLFKIIPDPGTPIYFGTVLPNFGLAGGGVEVFFPNGTSSGTVTLIGVIPEF